MIALLQRVSEARVSVDGETIGAIDRGLMVLVGFQRDDVDQRLPRFVERIINYRVFADEQGRMNRSLKSAGGGLLLVPQFTLAADTNAGHRPSFSSAAAPDTGRRLFDGMVRLARAELADVQTGRFGADMQVALVNDGPVTFWLEVH